MHYLLLALCSLAFSLFAKTCVNWWAPLLARQGEYVDRGVRYEGPVLPRWLKWFDTFDAHLDTGLQMGLYADLPWVAARPWLRRIFWLYRNTGYGFSYYVLGVPFVPSEWEVTDYAETPDGAVHFEAVHTPTAGRFNRRFNTYIKSDGGIEKFGWKAWNMLDREKLRAGADHPWHDQPWGPRWRIPFVVSFNPLKSIKT